jgi:Protein of unknown function (DUF3710)
VFVKFRRKSDETDLETDVEAAVEDVSPATGPFDAEDAPADGVPRLDLGSLLMPAIEGFELRLQVDEQTEEVRAVMLATSDGAMELRAFAAPRGGDLWSEIRPRISAEFAQRGGTATERDGRFGTELLCQVSVKAKDGRTGIQQSRIIGFNGPRWMLRATLLGRAAVELDAGTWEDVIEKVVVNRGNQPMPVGIELPLRVPADMPAPDSIG